MNQNSNISSRASSPSGNGKNVVEEAKDLASHTVDEVKDVATRATEQAREAATAKLGSQKNRAAEKIGNVADALRTAGESLDEGPLPDLAGRAADGIENLANYIKSRTVSDMIGEVERFARREPALFLGASFALGLLGGRFLKSSAKTNVEDEYDEPTYRGFNESPSYRRYERYETRQSSPRQQFDSREPQFGASRITPTPIAPSPVVTTPMQPIGEPSGNKTPTGGNRGGF